MKNMITTTTLTLLAVLMLPGCASDPEPQARDPYNDADSQRSRAGEAQREMPGGSSRY